MDSHRQWSFIADMNFDGIVTISDFWLWVKWLYFYPGDFFISVLIEAFPDITIFLELSPSDYGGLGSGFFSFIFFLFVYGFFISLIEDFDNR